MSATDRKFREKALFRLEAALIEARAPVLKDLAEGEHRLVFFSSLLGASRGSTVLLRLRTWAGFARWLRDSIGVRWPRSAKDVGDYIRYQVALAAPPSWPRQFAGALAWVEGRAGTEEKYSNADLVRRAVEWASMELAVDGLAVKKAPRLPVVAVMALELEVVDRRAPVRGAGS